MARRRKCPYGFSWCKGDCDRCTENRYARERRAAGGGEATFDSDGGYARWEGQDVYWDRDDRDGNDINIFPSGMPPRDHNSHDHDHIKVRGASIATVRGVTVITGGYVTWKRTNGVES
jgi:hypothetical protein